MCMWIQVPVVARGICPREMGLHAVRSPLTRVLGFDLWSSGRIA